MKLFIKKFSAFYCSFPFDGNTFPSILFSDSTSYSYNLLVFIIIHTNSKYRITPEKLIVAHKVNKFPTSNRIRRFIIVLPQDSASELHPSQLNPYISYPSYMKFELAL